MPQRHTHLQHRHWDRLARIGVPSSQPLRRQRLQSAGLSLRGPSRIATIMHMIHICATPCCGRTCSTPAKVYRSSSSTGLLTLDAVFSYFSSLTGIAVSGITIVMNYFIWAFLYLCGLGVAYPERPERGGTDYNITGIFEPYLSSGALIYYTSDANYSTEVMPRVSTFDPPSVFVTILPATVKDIQTVVCS